MVIGPLIISRPAQAGGMPNIVSRSSSQRRLGPAIGCLTSLPGCNLSVYMFTAPIKHSGVSFNQKLGLLLAPTLLQVLSHRMYRAKKHAGPSPSGRQPLRYGLGQHELQHPAFFGIEACHRRSIRAV
ncbi:hypothetical protein LY78DRAFT_658628 [Colletotrichum sublineola]|nr:hypothetical protein LY78DRAFT_658628 [Colletotrichum sublineola]